uniref:F-actin-capping protein subunit alpha n=1 Tax=Varanus komodoensis TaxID=61221 RepID=A0A8D2KWR8_VARKO
MADEETDHLLSKPEKVQVVSRLLKQVPPGEFKEAFSDLRTLVNDDTLMCEEAASLCAVHNKDHFTPVQSEECEVLLTRHNELEENHFIDPQKKISFKYDHLRRMPSDFQAHPEEDEKGEVWRRALQEALNAYVCSHYPEGLCKTLPCLNHQPGGCTSLGDPLLSGFLVLTSASWRDVPKKGLGCFTSKQGAVM